MSALKALGLLAGAGAGALAVTGVGVALSWTRIVGREHMGRR